MRRTADAARSLEALIAGIGRISCISLIMLEIISVRPYDIYLAIW